MKHTIIFFVIISLKCACCSAEPNLFSDKCDFWILAGQSNMQGYGKLPVRPDSNSHIIMLNMDNTWMTAQDPLHRLFAASAPIHRKLMFGNCSDAEYEKAKSQKTNLSESGVGPGYFFAKHLVENGIENIGLIPCAHGGTSMDQWSPDLKEQGGNSLYGAMLNRISLVNYKIKGILWYQGENDTDENLSEKYQQKMLKFIDSLRRDVNNPNLPFLYVQIGRLRINGLPESRWRAVERVRESQRQIMSLRSNVYMAVSCDLPLDDAVHISADGQKRLGIRLAEMALRYVYEKAEHASEIDIESVVAYNKAPEPYIKLRFKGVNGKLTAKGRPSDFDFISSNPIDGALSPYRTDFDPNDPASLLIRVTKPFTSDVKIIYGLGINPYMNIIDEKDMAVPAFGPYVITLN
jgi:sialate O-acetylesterase